MADERFRPGCFGSPLCYKPDHAVCTPCPFVGECAPASIARLEALRLRFGVAPKIKTVKPAAKPKEAKVAEKPKPAPKTQLERVALAIRARRNPFKADITGQRSWWLVCDVLLRKPDKAIFGVIASLVAKLLGVEIKMAAGHLKAILTQLMKSGAVVKRDGLYVIP